MSRGNVGRVHSIQTMGTLDGPGVRFVVFVQGCNLRCKCCHNPDTWAMDGGKTYAPEELVEKACRYRTYFGSEGGVTVSGGEPLLQADFVSEFFRLCHEAGLNTCLDTSGNVMNEQVLNLLSVTDRVLLDIKYINNDLYLENVGCSLDAPMAFLDELEKREIPTTIRQVMIPGVNADEASVLRLKNLAEGYRCVDKIELLPFRKICQTKYDAMGISFPFGHIPEADGALMAQLESVKK